MVATEATRSARTVDGVVAEDAVALARLQRVVVHEDQHSVRAHRRAMRVHGRSVVSEEVNYFHKAEVRRATPDAVGDIVVTLVVGRARWRLPAVPDAARVREVFESVIPRQQR